MFVWRSFIPSAAEGMLCPCSAEFPNIGSLEEAVHMMIPKNIFVLAPPPK